MNHVKFPGINGTARKAIQLETGSDKPTKPSDRDRFPPVELLVQRLSASHGQKAA